MVPDRRARIAGSTALVVRTVPKTWVSKSCRTSASTPSSRAAR